MSVMLIVKNVFLWLKCRHRDVYTTGQCHCQ